MRLIGYLVITASLSAGAIATTTAYVPLLTDDDAILAVGNGYAHLNAPAGARQDAIGRFVLGASGSRVALVDTGTELTPHVQARLRQARVARVRVKEFSVGRWQYAWLFALAIVGLVAGGMALKREDARDVARHEAETGVASQGSPHEAVTQIILITRELQRHLREMASERDQMQAIIDRLEQVQKELSLQVVEGRSILMGKLGLARFAEFMGTFSRMERTLNRAWSAAADGVAAEALQCIDDAAGYATDVEHQLRQA